MATKKTVSKSFDNIATRDLWDAVGRHDMGRLDRAIKGRANPNDQKAINSWSPPMTPLLKAAAEGFVAAIPYLVKSGAKRRATGPKGLSAFAMAVANKQHASFDVLSGALGAMSQTEILESFAEAPTSPLSHHDARSGMAAWTNKILDAIEAHRVKLAPATARTIAMNYLGGQIAGAASCPEIVQDMMDRKLIKPEHFTKVSEDPSVVFWVGSLAERNNKGQKEEASVILLHALEFPFGTVALGLSPGPVQDWVLAQQSIQDQAQLQSGTEQLPGRARVRQRL